VLLEDDIPAFNNLLQENDISHAITFSGQWDLTEDCDGELLRLDLYTWKTELVA
jgi:hypothetical protein